MKHYLFLQQLSKIFYCLAADTKRKSEGQMMRNLRVAHCSLGGLGYYRKKFFTFSRDESPEPEAQNCNSQDLQKGRSVSGEKFFEAAASRANK